MTPTESGHAPLAIGRTLWRAALLLAGLTASPAALGQNADKAGAEALFQEGKRLMDARSYAEACPKFEASLRLDPGGGGTALSLALCHESEGKTASAWAEYAGAESAARRDGRADRESFARDHRAALEPRLSRLTLKVSARTSALAGVEVKRDEAPIASAAWGVSLPVDPGRHVVTASAPGYQAFQTSVLVAAEGDQKTVEVPDLPPSGAFAGQAAPGGPVPSPLLEDRGAGPRRTGAYVLGGVGLAAVGLGGYFGLRAISQSSDARSACPNKLCASQADIDTNDRAKSAAKISDVGIGAGLLAIGAGAYLYFTSPDAPAPAVARLRAAPIVGTSGGGVSLQGRF